MESHMKTFVDHFLEFDDDYECQMDYAAGAMHLFTDSQFQTVLRMIDDRRKEQRKKIHQYLVTFTIDPSKHPDVTEELENKIVSYIETIPGRPALQLVACEYVRELHKSGRPHYHVKIRCYKTLRSDAFQTYEKAYGNVDISRSKCPEDEAHINAYLSKDNNPVKLL